LMGVDIQLLGQPQITVDGGLHRLKGRKSWGLLANVLLESKPTRRQIVDRLFADADDPMASLRWHLLQVRRAIEPGQIVETGGHLRFTGTGCRVDAVEILNGLLPLEQVSDVCRGELLEGMSFAETPPFDLWISLQRTRVAAAVGDTLRWAATVLSRTNPTEALALLERALLADPFDDSIHELAVGISARQSAAAAHAYIDRVRNVYKQELGVELPESILRPLSSPAISPTAPRLDSETSARTLMKVVEARLEANEYERAMEVARRAASAAAESGDRRLQARALLTLGRTLIHSVPGRDHESLGVLGRALQLADQEEDPELLAHIERETGYVALIAGRYGAAETAFTRSIRWANIAGDPVLEAQARTFRANCACDRNDYAAAEDDLQRALGELPSQADRAQRGFTRTGLARVLLRTGRVGEARSAATVALEELESGGWHGTVPWPLSLLGEALLAEGDIAGASQSCQQAFAFACEYPDACWEAISLRGMAQVAASQGNEEEAQRLLLEAIERAGRTPDTWRWAVAWVLTDLVELEKGAVQERAVEAYRIASTGPMPDLVQRLQKFLRPQTRPQTVPR
jgi:DNA-binding SARP family transcriptional activator